MNAQFNAELENALQCLLETYQMALEYETQDENYYVNMATKLIITKQNGKRHDEALEVAKGQRTTKDFEQEFQNEISTRMQKNFDAKKTTELKNFKNQLLQIKQEFQQSDIGASSSNTTRVESDDFVMESEINVYDPLTKQRMQHPVRNTLCNHHYEKSSIMEAIQINKRLRCPVAGCGNKQFVIMQHLVDDILFKKRLQKTAEQESQEE